MMTKTLVWHQGALGDLLLSLPSIYAIRQSFKKGRLHLVSRTDLADLILENGIADKVSSNEDSLLAPLFVDGDLPGKLRDFLCEYRSVFIFARRPDSFFLQRISECIPDIFFIQTFPPEDKVIHVSDFQLQNVKSAGIGIDARMPVLKADILHRSKQSAWTIAIHPGSGGRRKRWPVENYLELMSRLATSGGYEFRVLLGPAEDEEIFHKVAQWAAQRDDIAQIVRNMPISHIAAVLSSSDLFVGNDSGIAHLASSLGVPTIALFGPTDHRVWGPAGRSVTVVRSERACSPCGEKRNRCSDPECLKDIDPGSVIEEIAQLLKRSGK
jgi:ADP-heptose:LPS heptosyltransferase